MAHSTPNLDLPYIMPAQAKKHVTHNDALRKIDAITQLSVISRSQDFVPETADNGQRYLLPETSTGIWEDHGGALAIYQDGTWVYLSPQSGWICWVADEGALLIFDGIAWHSFPAQNNDTDMPDILGINAIADSFNRLSIKSPASLFDHEGDGHQIKVNKALTTDVASLIFQTNYSGRAEFGLTGDDNFHVKVSSDGQSFYEAMIIDKENGAVTFPNTPLSNIGAGTGTGLFDNATNFDISGRLSLVNTIDASSGIIYKKNAQPFFHNFSGDGSQNTNTFSGLNTGNFTMNRNGGGSHLASGNTFFGFSCGKAITTGYNNTLIGKSNGGKITSGLSNTLIGADVGRNITTGASNTVLGIFCGASLSSASSNNIFGGSSGNAITTASGNCLFGSSVAPFMNAYDTVAIGNNALTNLTTGSGNTAIGRNAGQGLTTGSGNTILGRAVGLSPSLSNNIILADGAGHIRLQIDNSGNITLPNNDNMPTTNPSDGGVIYIENGALKFRGTSGTITQIAPA